MILEANKLKTEEGLGDHALGQVNIQIKRSQQTESKKGHSEWAAFPFWCEVGGITGLPGVFLPGPEPRLSVGEMAPDCRQRAQAGERVSIQGLLPTLTLS